MEPQGSASREKPPEWVGGALAIAVLGTVVAALAAAVPGGTPFRALTLGLLSVPPVLLAFPGWLAVARRAAARGGFRWLAVACLLASLLPDRIARGDLATIVDAAAYVLAALLLTIDRPREPRVLVRDLLLVLVLWLPLEMGWVRGDFVSLRLFGLDVLLLLFAVERPMVAPRCVPVTRAEVAWGVGAWAAFLAIAVPLALALGFATPGIAEKSPGGWGLFVVGTFWIVALPEEALFRGVVQELLYRRLGRAVPALLLAAVVFGLSHLDNPTDVPAPDWRYVGLATLAGVAYGIGYLRTGNLAAPVLTHFLVDVTWRGFFTGRG